MTRGVIYCLLVVLGIVLVIVYYHADIAIQPTLEISNEEAKQRRFGLVVDVRTEKEREHLGYYPNSIRLDLSTIQRDIPVSKHTSILIYSNGDHRAQRAAELLHAIGFNNVRYIRTTYLSLMPGSA